MDKNPPERSTDCLWEHQKLGDKKEAATSTVQFQVEYFPHVLRENTWNSIPNSSETENSIKLISSQDWDFATNRLNGKESACNAVTLVQSLGQEDPLEKGMATHSGILARRIPWAEEPGGLQSTGWQRIINNWVTKTFITFFFPRVLK